MSGLVTMAPLLSDPLRVQVRRLRSVEVASSAIIFCQTGK